jgi:PadR family transcriptional regulator, regulatory protein PadR
MVRIRVARIQAQSCPQRPYKAIYRDLMRSDVLVSCTCRSPSRNLSVQTGLLFGIAASMQDYISYSSLPDSPLINSELLLLTARMIVYCSSRSSTGLMSRRESPLQSEMVQGTLDMLILRTLVLGPAHGQTIAHAIERGSEDVLQVEHGSLYPALHRLQNRGWIASFWGTSENNRKAKYYRLTPNGKKQLALHTSRWEQLVRAIGLILNPAEEKK